MIRRVKARACANIALVKYWGKQGRKRTPATPSIGLCLDCLVAETVVELLDCDSDSFSINGEAATGESFDRMAGYLDFWRKSGLIEGRFSVSGNNNFPTAAGLASSSAGFAALATALAVFAKREIKSRELSSLARVGSGSAARSIHGGLVAMPASDNPRAAPLAAREDVPWGMVVALVDSSGKATSSRVGMELMKKASPLYPGWVRQCKRDYRRALEAIRARDLGRLGRIVEENMLAMHGVMISTRPPLIYWRGETLNLIRLAAMLREEGTPCFATIDAGPNVMLLAARGDLQMISERARQIPGVHDAMIGLPGPAAEVVESA